MKKTLLSVLAVISAMSFSVAQSFTDGDLGYTLDVSASSASCQKTGANPAYMAAGDNIQSVTFSTAENAIDILAKASVNTAGAYPGFLGFLYNDGVNCEYISSSATPRGGIDMTTTTNRKVIVTMKGDVAGDVKFFLGSVANGGFSPTSSTYNTTAASPDDSDIRTVTLTTSYADYTFDYASSTAFTAMPGKNQVNQYGIDPQVANMHVYVQKIRIGSTAPVLESANNSITLSPNPASDNVHISMTEMSLESGAVVKVISSTGGIVFEAPVTSDNFDVNVSSYAKGIYMVQVISGNKVATQKVAVK